MIDLLKTIAISTLANGGVLALFLWVFKTSFEKSLDIHFKLRERELELRHKKDFHRFSKIFDEQASTIRDVYSELVLLNEHANHLAFHYRLVELHPQMLERYRVPSTGDAAAWERFHTATLGERKENLQADTLYKEALRTLMDFRRKRIYLPEASAREIEALLYLFLFVGSEFQNVSYRDPQDLKPVVAQEMIDAWENAVKASQRLFPLLESLFRAHLEGGA